MQQINHLLIQEDGESILIEIFLSVVAILSLILFCFVKYLDVLEERRANAVPLCGPDGIYKYEITVVTGQRPGAGTSCDKRKRMIKFTTAFTSAGTSARVGIWLFGKNRQGFCRHLFRPGSFKRSSVDVFLLATNEDLDEIDVLKVWHDNSGMSPSWYLSYIIVRNMQSGQKMFFVANCWLSLSDRQQRIQKGIRKAGEL
jgi:hypothetical protein